MPSNFDSLVKLCKRCKVEQPLSEFYFHVGTKDRHLNICKTCKKNEAKNYRLRYPEKVKSIKSKIYHDLKFEALRAYSGYEAKCACCGENEVTFLCIDHIDGNGNLLRRTKHGAGYSFLYWLKLHDYPAGFQVLCHNCNFGKYANGGVCPHQTALTTEEEVRA